MKALHDRAVAAGVILLNEVGLDPGIDHMMIMHAVDSIRSRGGEVEELVSLCGGLPDPVAADNPFLYKISWSPRGVLTAARNSARYLADGELIEVPGEKLLSSATPSNRFPTMRLEVIPNRDSLEYKGLYGIPQAKSICRGTLRYQGDYYCCLFAFVPSDLFDFDVTISGWANVMQALKVLNLMELNDIDNTTWLALIEQQMAKGGVNNKNGKSLEANLTEYLRREGSVQQPEAAVDALKWLGLWGNGPSAPNGAAAVAVRAKTPLDSLCKVMEDKLQFKPNERDMVAMFHSIVGRFPDGTIENHTSRLLDFGDTNVDGDSAMSKTVGYTTGAAAELILEGMMSTTGVSIPITAEVYKPMLKRIQDFGIHWTDKIEITKPNKQ
jgi:saccharopine dehydrogenase-like NADP-dependent oxidoreductase